MITKFLKSIFKKRTEINNEKIIIKKDKVPDVEYQKRWTMYQLTKDDRVFSDNYVLPEKIPTQISELPKNQNIFKYDYERLTFELEFSLRNADFNGVITEFRKKFRSDFKVHMDYIYTHFFRKKMYSVPENRNLTLFFLDYYKSKKSDYIISDIICNYSYNFDISDLEFFYKKTDDLMTDIAIESPLLISFLEKDLSKIAFYLKLGFKSNFYCKPVYIYGSEGKHISDKFILHKFDCIDELKKTKLRDAISELNVLNSDIISNTVN